MGGPNVGSILVAVKGGSRGGTPGQRQIPANGAPNTNPRLIQRLCLLPRENTHGMCWNIPLPILGGATFFKCWHTGFPCFAEFPRKGLHIHPSKVATNKVASAMSNFWYPAPAADLRSTSWGGGYILDMTSFLSAVVDADLDFLSKGKCFFAPAVKARTHTVGFLGIVPLQTIILIAPLAFKTLFPGIGLH